MKPTSFVKRPQTESERVIDNENVLGRLLTCCSEHTSRTRRRRKKRKSGEGNGKQSLLKCLGRCGFIPPFLFLGQKLRCHCGWLPLLGSVLEKVLDSSPELVSMELCDSTGL